MIFGYSCYLCDLVRRNSRHNESISDQKYLMDSLNRGSSKTISNSKWSNDDAFDDSPRSTVTGTRHSGTGSTRHSTRRTDSHRPLPEFETHQRQKSAESYSEYQTWKNQYKNLISITPLTPQNQHIQSQEQFRLTLITLD